MSRRRSVPPIDKPVIDPEAALRFAAEGAKVAAPRSRPPSEKRARSAKGPAAGTVRVEIELAQALHGVVAKAAERKGRIVSDVIERLVKKHFDS
jgi:hypothetical protein